jgi:5'-3' exonuclease
VSGGIYVFLRALAGLLSVVDGRKATVVWDGKDNRAFRRGRHPWYKHGRGSAINRNEVRAMMRELEPLLAAVGVATVSVDGHEADDVVATLATRRQSDGKMVLIFSDDKDYYQLVDRCTHLVRRQQKGFLLTPDTAEMFGIQVGSAYLQTKAMEGDTGDNIKPLDGFGEAKATAVMKKCPDFVERIVFEDADVDWVRSVLDDKLIKELVKAGRKRCFPTPPKPSARPFVEKMCKRIGLSSEIEIDEDACIEAALNAIRWSYDLVTMDRDIPVSDPDHPEVAPGSILNMLKRLNLHDERDLLHDMHSIAGVTYDPGVVMPARIDEEMAAAIDMF